MKPLVKYMILLLAGGITIPIYQYTGAVQTAPVIYTVKKTQQHVPANGQNAPKPSYIKAAAEKLFPVVKYF